MAPENNQEEVSWGELLAAAAKALSDFSHRASNALSEFLSDANKRAELILPLLEQLGEGARQLRDAYDEGVPSGWAALNVGEMLAVIDLMGETGWCLTTSPPPETLRELIAPTPESRGQLLLKAEAQILHDLDLELRATDGAPLLLFAVAARQAWDAHASGLFLASQALSSTALGALSDRRGPLRFKNLGDARTQLTRFDIEKAGLREIRFFAVARAVGTALATFPREGPEPKLFNRHASVHGLTSTQFTQLNSLTALMLLCGWLRELLWLHRAGIEEDGLGLVPTASD